MGQLKTDAGTHSREEESHYFSVFIGNTPITEHTVKPAWSTLSPVPFLKDWCSASFSTFGSYISCLHSQIVLLLHAVLAFPQDVSIHHPLLRAALLCSHADLGQAGFVQVFSFEHLQKSERRDFPAHPQSVPTICGWPEYKWHRAHQVLVISWKVIYSCKQSGHCIFCLKFAVFSVLDTVLSSSSTAKTYLMSYIVSMDRCLNNVDMFILYPAL